MREIDQYVLGKDTSWGPFLREFIECGVIGYVHEVHVDAPGGRICGEHYVDQYVFPEEMVDLAYFIQESLGRSAVISRDPDGSYLVERSLLIVREKG